MVINNENNNVSKGIGFWGSLQIAFIVLKLCNVIDWSWPIVLLPAIISVCGIAICLLVCLIIIAKEYMRYR